MTDLLREPIAQFVRDEFGAAGELRLTMPPLCGGLEAAAVSGVRAAWCGRRRPLLGRREVGPTTHRTALASAVRRRVGVANQEQSRGFQSASLPPEQRGRRLNPGETPRLVRFPWCG